MDPQVTTAAEESSMPCRRCVAPCLAFLSLLVVGSFLIPPELAAAERRRSRPRPPSGQTKNGRPSRPPKSEPSRARAVPEESVYTPGPPVDPSRPTVLQIVPRIGPEERARREREEIRRREELRPRIAAWCRAYLAAARPLRAAVDEALGSLRIALGPSSRGLGYPVHTAAAAFGPLGLLPVPDAALDRRLRGALSSLEAGADACMRGMPTVAQLRMEEGRRGLAGLESAMADYGVDVDGPACRQGETTPRR